MERPRKPKADAALAACDMFDEEPFLRRGNCSPSTITQDELKDLIRQETRRELRAALAEFHRERHEHQIHGSGSGPFVRRPAELPHDLQEFGVRLHRAVSDELQRFASSSCPCVGLFDEGRQVQLVPTECADNWLASAGRTSCKARPSLQPHTFTLADSSELGKQEYQKDCTPEPKAKDYREGRYSLLGMAESSSFTNCRPEPEVPSEKPPVIHRFSYRSLLEESENTAQGRGNLRPFTHVASLLSMHSDSSVEQRKPPVPQAEVVTHRLRRAAVGPRNSSLSSVLLQDMQLHRTRWGKGMYLKNLTIKSKLHGIVAQLVVNNHFDHAMCIILIFNAVALGLQVERAAGGNYADGDFRILERVFCVLFTLELAARLYVFRGSFFHDANWQWNSFDAIVVGLQVTEEFLDLMISLRGGGGIGEVSRNMKQVKMLRFLRLLRAMRVLRIVRFVQELSNITYLIVGSLWSFIWVSALLFLMTYIVGTFITQLVADWSQEHIGERFDAQRLLMRQSWGSIGTSVLSLYQGISGGVDWKEIVEPLSSINDEGIFPAFFSFYIAFAVLVMLNLVTGVFVESAHVLSRRDKKMELMRKMHMVLEVADIGKEGQIRWQEFRDQLQVPEVIAFFEAINMDLTEAETVFQLLDSAGEGSVSAEDFVLGGLRLQGPAKAIDLAKMQLENTLSTQALLQKIGSLRSSMQELCQDVRPSGNSSAVSLSFASPRQEMAKKDARLDAEYEDDFSDARSRQVAMVKLKSLGKRRDGVAAAGGAPSPSLSCMQRLMSYDGIESC